MSGLIKDRIAVLKKILDIPSDRGLEKGGLPGDDWVISNGQLSKWVDKDPAIFSSTTVEKFLRHYGINSDWWKTGKGEILDPNSTYVKIPSNNKQKPMEQDQFLDTFKSLVEGNTEYLLVPRGVLKDNYRLISLEQYQKDMEQLRKDREQIEMYKNEFVSKNNHIDSLLIANKELTSFNNDLLQKLLTKPPQSLGPQKGDQNPGVSQ
jgi:hypothetical protein